MNSYLRVQRRNERNSWEKKKRKTHTRGIENRKRRGKKRLDVEKINGK